MVSGSDPDTHKGWHSRGYLPHCDNAHATQHVVFRLADSLPATVLAGLEIAPNEQRSDAVEAMLDRGAGSRALGEARAAKIVEDALLHFDGRRYRLLAWRVMPAHVHVLVPQTEGWRLSSIIQSCKSFTAKAVGRPRSE